MKPRTNGLFEVNEKPKKDTFCMDLILFLCNEDASAEWDDWERTIDLAKEGRCPYRKRCRRHKRTLNRKRRHIISKNRR